MLHQTVNTAREAVTLSRRGSSFGSLASPEEKATLGFAVIFLIVGLALFVLNFVATTHAGSHFKPYGVLCVSSALFVLGHVARIAYTMNPYPTVRWITTAEGLRIFAHLCSRWAEVFTLAAAMVILWNRALLLQQVHPDQAVPYFGRAKKVGEMATFGLLALWTLLSPTLRGISFIKLLNGKINYAEHVDRYGNALVFGHLAVVFMFFLVADLGISALVINSRMRRVPVQDAPTTAIMSIISPLFAALWIWYLWYDVHSTSKHDRPPPVGADLGVELATVIVTGVLLTVANRVLGLGYGTRSVSPALRSRMKKQPGDTHQSRRTYRPD